MTPVEPRRDTPMPGANSALMLLMAINLFNYIDRQVLNAVLPRLKLDGTLFAADDAWINTKLGSLTSAFMVAYMIFAPIVGWLDGHGYRRWFILGLGVTVWSLASGSSGYANSFAMLFALRCVVGIGEGAYGPVSSAMLSDIYPTRLRGAVMALFNMAVPVGSALGFIIGGLVSDYAGDWRHAFWVTYLGLILGFVLFFKREFPRPTIVDGARHAYGDLLRGLRRNRSFVLCCAGMTAITFVIGGLAVWAPVYIFERQAQFAVTDASLNRLANPAADETRRPVPPEVIAKLEPMKDGQIHDIGSVKKHLNRELTPAEYALNSESIYSVLATEDSPKPGEVSFKFGVILVLGGLTATGVGGWLGERFRERFRGWYFWVIGLGAIFAFPFYIAMLYAPFPLAWLFIFLVIFGLFLHIGPGFTIIANVVTSEVRATAFAINILVIHALGDVISPPIIGFIADRVDLHTAILATGSMILVGAALWISGSYSLEADTEAAERNS
jgi:MFS family permease